MNYNEAMNYLENTAKFGMKFGLERTERILEILGNPHKNIKAIHIAGTNGKGSTTAMLNQILIEAGYKVGMYTSPYIEEFEERIQISNSYIKKEEFAEAITELSIVIDKVIKEGYGEPTYFEIVTTVAFLYFYKKNVDFAVIEVGLGGRLDSTNVLSPILTLITSISYDHMDILGDTLEKIAYEKAGIIKENTPLILYPQFEESERVIENRCKELNAPLIKINKDSARFIKVIEGEEIRQIISIKSVDENYDIELNLLGKHQLLNCSLCIQAIEALKKQGVNIEKQHILEGLKKVKWPGRLERMKREPLVVIDGAHNIDGIKKLKESVETYFKYNNIILILGILKDKEVENMVETIAPLAKHIITVTPHSDRAKLSLELKEIVEKYNKNCSYEEEYENGYKKALELASNDDLILISGSLYMIGDMRKIINHNN